MPLRQVRTAVRLVAQDAVLLEGTLLENLYTFSGEEHGAYDVSAAWRELERVEMRARIEALPEKLHTRVGAGMVSATPAPLLPAAPLPDPRFRPALSCARLPRHLSFRHRYVGG